MSHELTAVNRQRPGNNLNTAKGKGQARILMLAPVCLQEADPEAIVSAKLARALMRAGYDLYVLTAESDVRTYRYPPTLADGRDDLSRVCHSINMPARWTVQNALLHFRAARETGYLWKGVGWAGGATGTAVALQMHRRYSAVISRSSPSELVALVLAKHHGAKWIATWNDPYPWERYPVPYRDGPTAKLSASKERLLIEVAKYAAWHVFPCERLRDYMLSYMPEEIRNRSSIIPHLIAESPAPPPRHLETRTMNIVHAGALTPPRASEQFLKGLRLFVQREGVDPSTVRVHFIGLIPPNFQGMLRECSVASYCTFHGPVDYSAANKRISSADVALLIEADLDEGIFFPSKFVDYLQCGRPIFAVGPREGTVSDLIGQYGGGVVADCRSPQAIAEGLRVMYRSWCSGRLAQDYAVGRLRDCFTEDRAMATVAKILDAVMAGDRLTARRT